MAPSTLLMIVALATPPVTPPSLSAAAENWINAHSVHGFELVHLSSVKADGTLVCAYGRAPFVDPANAYLIDAARWVAWTDTSVSTAIQPQRLFRMEGPQREQWRRCEKTGVSR